MNIISEANLVSGELGCKMMIPSGVITPSDSVSERKLIISDHSNEVLWSINYFENLHMDLSIRTRNHLEQSIVRMVQSYFGAKDRDSIGTAGTVPLHAGQATRSSPLLTLEYRTVPTISGGFTTALEIIHRSAPRRGHRHIIGRFFLPLQGGLLEVIVESGKGKARELDVNRGTCTSNKEEHEQERTATFDANNETERVVDDHWLRRVQDSLSWLRNDSELIVTAPPNNELDSLVGADITLTHLGCTLRPPPRYTLCPNPSNPGSNKQRFCRATLGGSVGVQMMVVSCWYTHEYAPNLRKGTRGLCQIARHGAMAIHRSQNLLNIRVQVEEVQVARRSWLGVGNKDAVITLVQCNEAGGAEHQNTIGWVREAPSDVVYLIYCADTQGQEQPQVRKELLESLSSLRGGSRRLHVRRRRNKKDVWNASMAVRDARRSL